MTAPVHLYFDGRCGPCALFAHVSGALGRGRLTLVPFASGEADRELAPLPPAERSGAFHLVHGDDVKSGELAVVPLVGLTFGAPAERVARGAPPVRRGLQWTYRRFWQYRRTRGCAAPAR